MSSISIAVIILVNSIAEYFQARDKKLWKLGNLQIGPSIIEIKNTNLSNNHYQKEMKVRATAAFLILMCCLSSLHAT